MKTIKKIIEKAEWTNQRREELRKWAIKIAGGCKIQTGEGDKKKYPCGTCFCMGLTKLLKQTSVYKEHNEPIDRINEVWRALLQIRNKKY